MVYVSKAKGKVHSGMPPQASGISLTHVASAGSKTNSRTHPQAPGDSTPTPAANIRGPDGSRTRLQAWRNSDRTHLMKFQSEVNLPTRHRATENPDIAPVGKSKVKPQFPDASPASKCSVLFPQDPSRHTPWTECLKSFLATHEKLFKGNIITPRTSFSARKKPFFYIYIRSQQNKKLTTRLDLLSPPQPSLAYTSLGRRPAITTGRQLPA